ncbi:MAG: DNA adenine methylase [Bacilli bacterium]
MKLQINNRRYIGSKNSLLSNIEKVIKKYYKTYDFVLADVFAGTGVVGNYFANKGSKVIVNDLLFSNYVAYNTWLSDDEYDINKIEKIINEYNSLNPNDLNDNYFSEKFGNKYFHENDAKIIGYIRDDLEEKRKKISGREFYIILTSLMYETDKIANTCGHFESFLNKVPIEKGVQLRIPDIKKLKQKNEIFCKDANQLVREIEADVFYIDPPYNARQYVNFYHVLENLALWQKPEELEGNSMKFKRNHLKSDYSKAKAPVVFEDLINNIKGKLIVVSYNNTYDAKSGASNNKISEKQIEDILTKKGKLTKIEIDYKFFNAGKTDLKNHKEYLYVCEVKK